MWTFTYDLSLAAPVHLPLIFAGSSSLAMQRRKRTVGIWAVILGLIALSFSACTSAPAPIVYASRSPGPIASYPPTAQRSPLPAPSVDLSTPRFDEFTAPRFASDQPPSECVPFARNISGIQIWGDAVTWWTQAEGRYPRSRRPAEGSVLVLRGYQDHRRGHVAVVKGLVAPRIVRVDHANWLNSGEVTLDVPVIDVSPDNDWSEVRVWHVPGMHWGGRTYQAEGFIHPISLNLLG
jgi:hypothetical protein